MEEDCVDVSSLELRYKILSLKYEAQVAAGGFVEEERFGLLYSRYRS